VSDELTTEEMAFLDFLADELAREAMTAAPTESSEYSSEKSVTRPPGARRARRRGAG